MKEPIVQKRNRLSEKRTITKIKILEFLARYPFDSFTLTEIAKKAKVSKAAASKIVRELEAEGYVTIGELAKLLWRVRYNLDKLPARGFKISSSLLIIYQSRIIEYIIKKWGSPRAIVLFGSVRKGEDGPGSDIDIAVETDREQDVEFVSLDAFDDEESQKLREFENVVERKFRICFFNRKRTDPNLFLSIVNGILLYGFLEVPSWITKESKN